MAGKLWIASWVTAFLLIAFQAFTDRGPNQDHRRGRRHEPEHDSAPRRAAARTVCQARDRGAHRAY